MQRQTFEGVHAFAGLSQLPIRLPPVSHRLSHLPGLLFMAALALVTVLPQLALAGFAITSPATRSVLIEHPMIAVELAVAAGFWAFLVLWPLRSIVLTVFRERSIEIADGAIRVVDRNPFSTTGWHLPLAAYDGLAHHVRSSLSGIRHEAVLVHSRRDRTVTLAAAPVIGKREITELCRLLQLPEVPSSRLYRLGGPGDGQKTTIDTVSVAA